MDNLKPVRGISGTLVSAIVGVNPWRTPLQAYNAIFGLDDVEEKEAMTWGTRLEPLLAQEYVDRTGAILWPNVEYGLDYRNPLRHKEIPWWTGTPDRLVIEDDSYLIPPSMFRTGQAKEIIDTHLQSEQFWNQVIKGWEGKTAGPRMMTYWGEEGTDEIPEIYLVQSTWYLGLANSYNQRITQWDVSVLLGGQQYRVYTIDLSAKLLQVLYQKCAEFWQMVESRTPPPPSHDPAWQTFFKKFLPRETEPMEEATEQETRLFRALYDAHQQVEIWTKQYETIANALKMTIGEKAGIFGYLDGLEWKLTWKTTRDTQKTDYKAVINRLYEMFPEQKAVIDAIVAENTITVPGVRRFLPSWPKEIKPKKGKSA